MTDEQIDSLKRENAHLRVIAQKVGCPYGHRNEGVCSLGYPGCACMDDLLAMTAWQPEDEGKAAVRLGQQVEQLTAERDELRTRNEQAAELINHAIKLMTPDQIGQWAGVRAWLESMDDTV